MRAHVCVWEGGLAHARVRACVCVWCVQGTGVCAEKSVFGARGGVEYGRTGCSGVGLRVGVGCRGRV